MSKYVKEMMMDQLRADINGDRSLLILDLKGLDAIAEHQFRHNLRKKKIRVPSAQEYARPADLRQMGLFGPVAVSRRSVGPRLGRRRRRRAGQGGLDQGQGAEEASDQGRGRRRRRHRGRRR